MEKQTKKILFMVTKGNFGGAQRYVFDLATNLPKDQFESVVACGEGTSLRNKLKEKNIRVVELLSSQRDINIIKDIKAFFEIKKIIDQERPDILHVNSSKAGGLGALAGRLAGVPKIIFTAHGWAFNENRSSLSKFIILCLHWITILLSHSTIAVSRKTKRDIGSMPFVEHKIKVVHNGLEHFDLLPRAEAEQILVKKNDKQVVFFTLSELHWNKGLDTALQGIAELPSEIKEKIIYYIAGSGEERERLENLVEKLGIKDSVCFLGFVDDAKKLLSGADVFLFPSRNENLPFAILEAGYAGLPIIATSVGGIPEIIKDMQNGILIHKDNKKEVLEAITHLLNHPEKQKEFGEEIRKTVSTFFTLDKMVQETVRVYELT